MAFLRDPELLVLFAPGCVLLLLILAFVLQLLHYAALSRALAACSPSRRMLAPELVWLNLVPILHLFWRFWTVAMVGESLHREYLARGLRTEFAFGRGVGGAAATITLCVRLVFAGGIGLSYLLGAWRGDGIAQISLVLAFLLGLVEMILNCVHWGQVKSYTRQLKDNTQEAANTETGSNDWNDREFDENYRPIPLRRR